MPERHFVANSMTQAIAKVSMDRGIFKISMETAVACQCDRRIGYLGNTLAHELPQGIHIIGIY